MAELFLKLFHHLMWTSSVPGSRRTKTQTRDQSNHSAGWTGHASHQVFLSVIWSSLHPSFSFPLLCTVLSQLLLILHRTSVHSTGGKSSGSQQRGIGDSIQRIIKGLLKRCVYDVEICHSPCFTGGFNVLQRCSIYHFYVCGGFSNDNENYSRIIQIILQLHSSK